jgi:hypothetical protein
MAGLFAARICSGFERTPEPGLQIEHHDEQGVSLV